MNLILLLKIKIKGFINKFGFNISKFDLTNQDYRLSLFLKLKSIDCVFDVGASSGQYGNLLRQIGYKNKIVSFEPLSKTYEDLKKEAKKDIYWDTYNIGLGAISFKTEINISKNSESSSILKMNKEHTEVCPESEYIDKEDINVKSLDEFVADNKIEFKSFFLKIDAQGYEEQILDGIKNFDNIEGIQVEMSLNELYKDQILFEDLYKKIKDKGYELWDFRRGFANTENGKLLQLDGIFFKKN
jgi:FkbM family methyltransferase